MSALVLDTGLVYAYYDRSDAWHARARASISRETQGLILPAPVIPEVDHLLGARLGGRCQQAFYAGIIDGHYLVVDVPPEGYRRAAALTLRFAELELGFVDASIVALAESLGLRRIGTTDRRHFGPLAAAFSLQLVP